MCAIMRSCYHFSLLGDTAMKKLASFATTLLLAGLLVVLLSSCGTQRDFKYKVGVSLMTEQHWFYQDLKQAMEDSQARNDCQLIFHSAEFDSNKQMEQIRSFITQRLDAAIICPVDSAAIVPAIEEANKAGLPIFTADVKPDDGEIVCHVASDNVQGGELAAKQMAKLLNDKGNIVIIDYPAPRSVQDRVKGFRDELKKHPNIHILDAPSGEGKKDKAFEVMKNMLVKYQDLQGVFGINDDSALGAVQAIRAAHRKGIVVVGYDGGPEAVQEMAKSDSPLKACVTQYPRKIGKAVVDAVGSYLGGGTPDAEILIPVGVIDAEKAKQLLEQQKQQEAAEQAGELPGADTETEKSPK